MCGRYYVDGEMEEKIRHTLGQVEAVLRLGEQEKRDVHPGDTAAVLTGRQDWKLEAMEWGLPADSEEDRRKRRIINVRSETVMDKPGFQRAILRNRCVIPAMGFYEWNREREKAEFFRPDGMVLYMAGFYEWIGDRERFTILTTSANPSVAPVHGRMPLILEADELEDWMGEEKNVIRLLKKIPGRLKRRQEYEQQILPFLL